MHLREIAFLVRRTQTARPFPVFWYDLSSDAREKKKLLFSHRKEKKKDKRQKEKKKEEERKREKIVHKILTLLKQSKE